MENHGGGYFYLGEDDPKIGDVIKTHYPVLIEKMKKDPVKSSFRFNIYLIMDILSSFKRLDIPSHILKTYCRERYLNNQRVKETIKMTKKLTMRFYRGKQINIGNFNVDYELSLIHI